MNLWMKKMTCAAAAVMLLSMPALALAQAPATQPAAEAATISFKSDGSVWKGILNGAIAGVMAALLGWIKNRNTQTGEMQRFEIKYLVPTALVGVIVGIVSALLKMTPADLVTTLETSPVFAAVVLAAEAGLKAVWRNTVPMVRDMIGDVKAGAGNPTPPAPPQQ